MHRPLLICALAALALPFSANAAHRKPGLWESTTTLRFTKGGPQIPPDVQAQMKQRGIKMPGSGEPHTFRQCLTPEEAARDEHPQIGGKDCTVQNAVWSGDNFHGELVCHSAQHESHGTFDATLHGGESYAGTMHVEGKDPRLGGDYVMEGSFSGKWLGPRCGKEG